MGRTKQNKVASDKPNPPKRPLSGFFLYKSAVYDKVKSQNPDSKMTDLTKIISNQWQEIDEEQKKKYEELAKEKKEEYKQAIQDYEDQYGKIEKKKKTKKKGSDDDDEASDEDAKPKKKTAKRVKKNKDD